MDKILILNKPVNISSAGILNKLKKKLNVRSLGHAGTLDPFATGVLIVASGRATKVLPYFQALPKTYSAIIQLGLCTDTDDITGNIIHQKEGRVSLSEIQNIIPQFIGNIQQIPPKYSALKINGERAYHLARQNHEFELKSRSVTVHHLKIQHFDDESQTLKMDIECSTGTYIRALARDIGFALETFGTLLSLERTSIGMYSTANAILEEDVFSQSFQAIDKVLDYLPKLHLKNEFTKIVANGAPIHGEFIDRQVMQTIEGYSPSYYLLYDSQDHFLGLVDNRTKHFMYKVL